MGCVDRLRPSAAASTAGDLADRLNQASSALLTKKGELDINKLITNILIHFII